MLVISPDKGHKTVQDLVKAAKAKPGAMNYASAGVGTATQLNGERFRLGAGIEVVHVPFKGTPEALTEVIAGRVDYYFCPVNAVLQMVAEKKLLGLAVGSTKRSMALPERGDDGRSRRPELGLQFLGRHGGVVEDAARDRDPAASGDREGAREQGGARQHGQARRRADADAAWTSSTRYIRNEVKINAALVKAAGIKTQ